MKIENNVPTPDGIQIENNIPAPLPKKWRKWNLPINGMLVGQSILVPLDARSAARMAIQRHARAHGTEWTTKVCDGGIRVWRTK